MTHSGSLLQRALSGLLVALLACAFAAAGCGKYGKPTRRGPEKHALAPEKRYTLGTAPQPEVPEKQVSKQDRGSA